MSKKYDFTEIPKEPRKGKGHITKDGKNITPSKNKK